MGRQKWEVQGLLPTPPIEIVQDASTITIVRRDESRSTYRLDGRETTEQVRLSDGTTGPETSLAAWNGGTLIITMHSKARVRRHEYSLDDQGRLVFVSETSLLAREADGRLAVKSIGRWTRVYRRASSSFALLSSHF